MLHFHGHPEHDQKTIFLQDHFKCEMAGLYNQQRFFYSDHTHIPSPCRQEGPSFLWFPYYVACAEIEVQ